MKTTFEELMRHNPCTKGTSLLVTNTGRISGYVSFREILDSNGLDDATWCLRIFGDYDLNVMKFKMLCCRLVESVDYTGRSKYSLDILERFLSGNETLDTLISARRSLHNYSVNNFHESVRCYAAMDSTMYALKGNPGSAYNAIVHSCNASEIGEYYNTVQRQIEIFKEIFCKDD